MTQVELFKTIWLNREHKSSLSGLPLKNNHLWLNQFAHILPKSKFPEFRVKSFNIALLTPEEHTLFDAGTDRQRQRYSEEHNCDWEKLFSLEVRLWLLYKHRYGHAPYINRVASRI